jgi:hypothetical protein
VNVESIRKLRHLTHEVTAALREKRGDRFGSQHLAARACDGLHRNAGIYARDAGRRHVAAVISLDDDLVGAQRVIGSDGG